MVHDFFLHQLRTRFTGRLLVFPKQLRLLLPVLLALPLLTQAANPVLTLEGTGSVSTLGADVTVFVDQVEILSGGVVVSGGVANNGFENPVLAAGTFMGNPATPSWTFNNGGIASNGSPYNAPTAPEGSQVAFLQMFSVSISQTLALAAGTYQVRLRVAQRNFATADQGLNVLIDGVVVGTVVPANNGAFATYVSNSFAVNVPTLTGLSSPAAAVGASLTLTGTNLTGTSSITFPGTSSNVVTTGFTVNAAGTQITNVVVPSGANNGNVSLTTAAGSSNGVFFRLTAPARPNTYQPVSVSGFDNDVVANGQLQTPGSFTTINFNPIGYIVLVEQGFSNQRGEVATDGFPRNGRISTASGVPYALGSYSGNNALTVRPLPYPSGTLSLVTPTAAQKVYLLATSTNTSNGAVNAMDVTVSFTDGTSELFSQVPVIDWVNAVSYTPLGLTRSDGDSFIDGDIYKYGLGLNEVELSLSLGNQSKLVSGVTMRNLDNDVQFIQVMGMSVLTPTGTAPTITALSPTRNLRNAPRASNVALTFSQAISSATAGNIRIHSQQRGGQLVRAGGGVVSGGGTATVTFNPTTDFKPGETVFVTVPASVQGTAGAAITNPQVYQFTAAAGAASGTFAARTDFNTGTQPYGVALGDVSGDGVLDMVVVNDGSASASVLLGTGTGSFGPKTDYTTGLNPEVVALGDVNGDGKLDIVTASNGSSAASVLLNTGTGSFGPKTDYPTGAQTRSVALGDLNGDGALDIVTANYNGNNASVLLNTGTGSFGSKTDYTVGANPAGVTLGDVDGDGRLDLVVANLGSSSISVLPGTGTGSFSPKTDYLTGLNPVGVALGDVNNDGKLDIAVANLGTGANSASVLLNTGTGSFATRTDYTTGTQAISVALGDVNGDGNLDMVTANYGNSTASVLLGMGTGSFGTPADYATGTQAISVALGDVNGDGTLDMVTANNGSNTVSVRLNQPPPPTITALSPTRNLRNAPRASNVALTFSQAISSATAGNIRIHSQQRGGQLVRAGQGVVSGGGTATVTFNPTTDFKPGETVFVTVPATVQNTTGAALANPQVYQFTAAAGAASGTFAGGSEIGTSSGGFVAVGDLDGDGDLDLVVTDIDYNQGVPQLRVALNTGTGTYGALTTVATSSSEFLRPALADVDGDGDLDVLAAEYNNNTVIVRLNNGSGAFSGGSDVPVGQSPTDVVMGDIDGDGDLDLLVPNYGNGTVSVRLNDGAGAFSGTTEVPIGDRLAVADVDSDGDLDMLSTANDGSFSVVVVLLNNGSGTFSATPRQSANVGARVFEIATGDVDGDGDLDMLTANTTENTVSVRLNNGSGTFSGTQDVAVGTVPTSVALGDVDGDGDLDFLTTNRGPSYDGTTVSVRLNNGTGTFSGGSDPSVSVAPNSVALGDVDSDGDLDLIAGSDGHGGLGVIGRVSVRLNQPPPVPTITALAPAAGTNIGAVVTITGTNLSTATTASFNGTTATLTAGGTATSRTVTVPAGATTGPVTVTSPSGTSAPTASYNILPYITAFTPTSGPVGTTVTITGSALTGATVVKFGAVNAASFTVNSSTSITAVVAAGTITGKVTVTTPSGTRVTGLSFTVTASPVPTLTSFTPASGPVGTSVTLTGTGFTGASAVRFNGTSAVFTAASATSITTSVPSGATSGTLSVTTPGGTATSAGTFTVTVLTPTLTSFTPASGPVGTSVTITGTGFTNASAVTFNGTAATSFAVVSPTSMTATVPTGATTGLIRVTTPGGTASSATSFTVTANVPPTLTSFTPTAGMLGTSVTLTGTNFTGATVVKFNLTNATSFTVVSSTTITTAVPAGATTGKLSVTTPGGTAVSVASFTVQVPTITSFTPAAGGAVGAAVTLTGTNFVNVTGVALNGVALTSYTVVSATSITTTVPATATTGKFSVTTPTGTGTSVGIFKVLPVISSLTPTQGAPGTVVTITGSGFTGATAVKFLTVAATSFTVNSSTQITATVPVGALTGKVYVTTAGGTATSAATFTLTPTISSFTPAQGAVGSLVIVTGLNFTTTTKVYFHGTLATTTYNSATQLTATVPTGATTGTLAATNATGTGTSATSYTITTGALATITSFTTQNVAVGRPVTITGTNFTGASAVRFNTVSTSTLTSVSATQIVVRVPVGATTGVIYVTTPNGMVKSAASLTIIPAPTVTSFSPLSGSPGSVVLIAGTNFSSATMTARISVRFNGAEVPTFTVNSATQIAATVPASATTGKISVTTVADSATSAASFTVTTAPAPTITGFTPATGPRGSSVVLTGTNFTGVTSVKLGTVAVAAASYVVNSATQITLNVPATGITAKFFVTAAGGMAQSATSYTVILPPTISSFTPTSGPNGTLVTINGTNLTGASSVAFGGVSAASYTVVSAAKITATVAAGSATGAVTVTTVAGTATRSTFTYTGVRTTGPLATSANAADVAPMRLAVYPNPATAWVEVAVTNLTTPTTATTTVELLDGVGRVVRTAALAENRVKLSVAGLPAGVYTVRVGAATQRLVIE